MKITLIISALCLSAISSFAQNQDEATKRRLVHEKALAIYCRTNGNMGAHTKMHYKTDYSNVHAAYPDAPVNAKPARPSGDYYAVQDPPCYRYKNASGREVTECPGARSGAPKCDAATLTMNENQTNVRSERSFSGYYPNLHSLYPNAPANAVPAWPTTPYQELQNPPCYKYVNKRGLEVTECPGAYFEPEHRYR